MIYSRQHEIYSTQNTFEAKRDIFEAKYAIFEATRGNEAKSEATGTRLEGAAAAGQN